MPFLRRCLPFLLLLLVCPALAQPAATEPGVRVLIDADTANEVDDLYAVVRALIEPSWEVVGVNATQWQSSQWATAQTMEDSHRLNEVLLAYLNLNGRVPANRGAEGRLYDWGTQARTSAASNAIVREAHRTTTGQLHVVALGALTNVATAILDDPSILPRIRVYWLGSTYDFERGIMGTVDFNAVMDVQATDLVLRSGAELHIIPVNVAAAMTMDWAETGARFRGRHDLLDFLLHRWFVHHDGSRSRRTIWDLALIQAMIHPEMAEAVTVRTSAERGEREVRLYRRIDADRMREEFFTSVLHHLALPR
jgi:purine nucleosidase